MVILGQKGLSGLVKYFLDIVFAGGIVIFLTLPVTLSFYFDKINRISNENYHFLLGFLYITGLFCLTIVFEMRRIFKTLNRRNPFMMDNVKSLTRISIASFLIAASYFVKMFFYGSILTIIIAMVFVIAGLFSIILAEVFHQAVEVKEENDLTI